MHAEEVASNDILDLTNGTRWAKSIVHFNPQSVFDELLIYIAGVSPFRLEFVCNNLLLIHIFFQDAPSDSIQPDIVQMI